MDFNGNIMLNMQMPSSGWGTIGIYPGTGSGMGEKIAQLISRLSSSNSGALEEEFSNCGLSTAADILHHLKNTTGMSWSKIAELFNVSRRAVYDWLEGKSIAEHNLSSLYSVVKAVDSLNLPSPHHTRLVLLYKTPTGTSPFRLLKEARYEEFRRLRVDETIEQFGKALERDPSRITLIDRLSVNEDIVHTDLPGKKRSRASRHRSAD